MYRWGGEVHIPCKNAVPFIQQLTRSPVQHQQGKAGVGADREVTLEGGGGAGSIGKVLPYSSSGVTLVWSGDMGAYKDNSSEVRGSPC